MTTPEKQVHIYGLKRSGTCYTTFLLERNYWTKVLEANPDKHKFGPKAKPKPKIPSVMLIKHPLSWAVSIYKYEQWLRGHHKRLAKLPPFRGYVVKKLSDFWAKGNKHMLASVIGDNPFCIIRCEDLMENSKATISAVAKRMGLKRKSKNWITSNKSMKPKHGGKESNEPFEKERYDNKLFMKRYPKRLLNKVWGKVDKLLTNVFRYEKNGDW